MMLFDEFIESDANRTQLGVGSQNFCNCVLEVTLNYPRVNGFKNASSVLQKRKYKAIWDVIRVTFGITNLVSDRHVFEFCKSGHVHLHGVLVVKQPGRMPDVGIVGDLVKRYLLLMPARYKGYKETCMKSYSDGAKYTCPSICVKFVSIDDTVRQGKWNAYMNKTFIEEEKNNNI